MLEKEKKMKDAIDKKIEEFKEFKSKVPPPEVMHDRGDTYKGDILVNNITLLAGGKTLIDKA